MIFSLLGIWIKNGKLYLPHGGDNRPILLWYQVFSYFILFSKQWLFSSFLFYIYYLIWILFFCELERFDIVLSPFYTIFYWILCVVLLLITLTICLIILSLFSNMIFPPLLLLRHVFLLGFKFFLRVIGLHKGREMLICLLN